METVRWPGDGDENLTLNRLLDQHPKYSAGAVDDLEEFPSTQPIFYLADRFTLLDQGWFFFSETPDVIYSRTCNGSFPAFASWIELEATNTGTVFKVLNLHTDFASYGNRHQSLELVASRITPWLEASEATIITGDYNAWQGSRLQQIIADTGLSFAPLTASTYHFDHGLRVLHAIDHVAYSSAFILTNQPVVLQQKFLDEWPTDHYPVVIDLAY
jgi:endonuclease/exonuclease/phosphatase family metal-dependent hydrolase